MCTGQWHPHSKAVTACAEFRHLQQTNGRISLHHIDLHRFIEFALLLNVNCTFLKSSYIEKSLMSFDDRL